MTSIYIKLKADTDTPPLCPFLEGSPCTRIDNLDIQGGEYVINDKLCNLCLQGKITTKLDNIANVVMGGNK